MPRHIRKGDDVVILSGDFRGATGTVVRVIPKSDRVVVKGPRIPGITKNLKPTRINPQGGQVTVDRSFHMSSVSPAVEGRASRVRFETRSDGSKVRVAVQKGKVVKELGVVRGAASASRKKK
ncbi:MAG: 50S ribosomal protein L24 [Planctomycetota bacterium]|nr:50S ribosomal protein L24 [Planctomycetota bacterium]